MAGRPARLLNSTTDDHIVFLLFLSFILRTYFLRIKYLANWSMIIQKRNYGLKISTRWNHYLEQLPPSSKLKQIKGLVFLLKGTFFAFNVVQSGMLEKL